MKYLHTTLAMLILMACGKSEKNNETTIEQSPYNNEIIISESQFTNENMKLGKAEEHVFNTTIKTTGIIDVPPQNKSIVSTFIGGYIKKTSLLVGDKVTKGQVLATLENPEFIEIQQQYLEIAEQLTFLKSEYARQKTLFSENITSQKNFLKAESTYKSSLAHYNGLQKKIKMLNINPKSVEKGQITSSINLYSSIDGFITKMNISNGMYVSPSNVIMEIVDTNHIHLELSIFEKDILNIRKGQKIEFKIPEASNKIFKAEVHLVGTSIDKTTRTVHLHGHIHDESQAHFVIGMFVEADIITESTKNLALPKSAIINVNNNAYTLVLRNKENDNFYFEKIKINIGNQTEELVTIKNSEDLNNKNILVEGAYMLNEIAE